MNYEILEDGTIIADDGTIATPDGNTYAPDGSVLYDATGEADSPTVRDSVFSSAIDAIGRLAQAGIVTAQQWQLSQINLERAKRGQSIITAQQAGVGLPVTVGLSPDVQKYLLIGGAGLLAFLLLGMVRR